MEILNAYDLTGSLRDAGELAGCSHHTVKRYVERRAAGGELDQAAQRPMLIDEYLPKVEEWVERSKGKVRADVAHDKLVALGYTGAEHTTRRAVAKVKQSYRAGHVRVHRPWITEPGMWLQYDNGDGPVVDGVKTVLFVAWLAWSRFRVVLPIRDKTMPRRRLRLPHIRRHAPEVVATAKAQRWEPAEVLKALFAEEVAGRGTLRPGHQAGDRGVPDREDLRCLAARGLLDPRPDPAGAAHPGVGPPSGEPRRVRPVVDREDVPARGAGPTGRRGRAQGRLVHPGRLRRPAAPSPCRRHRDQGYRPVLRADLVVVDDIGLLPVAADAAEGLYRLVDAGYEKRSIAICRSRSTRTCTHPKRTGPRERVQACT